MSHRKKDQMDVKGSGRENLNEQCTPHCFKFFDFLKKRDRNLKIATAAVDTKIGGAPV